MEQKILQSWLNGDLDKYADNNDEVYNILEKPTQTKINTELYDHGFNDCLKILGLINNKRHEIGLPGFNNFRLPWKNIKHRLTEEEKLLIELENYTKKILVYQKNLGESYITGYYDCLSAWNFKDEACSYVLGCVISGKPVVNPEDIITKPLSDETTKEILRATKEAEQKNPCCNKETKIMKILRNKSFSDPDKKKEEREKKNDRELLKKTAVLSSIPIALTQAATRIDDVIAKRDAVKKAKEIRNNRNKHIKNFERIAKDKIEYAKAEEGVGKVSDKIGKMLDDMGIKREKQSFRTQEDKERLEEAINHAKKNLKDEKVLIDSASKLVSMTNRDVRDLRLKNNKKLRKYGAALSAGMVVGSGIGIAAKKHKKKMKDENTKR